MKGILAWKFSLLILLWLAALGFAASSALGPLLAKKRASVSVGGQAPVRLVYSQAQFDNEVIYDVKTRWEPRITQDARAYSGQVITEPYDRFVRARMARLLANYLLLALAPPLLLLLAWRDWRRASG